MRRRSDDERDILRLQEKAKWAHAYGERAQAINNQRSQIRAANLWQAREGQMDQLAAARVAPLR